TPTSGTTPRLIIEQQVGSTPTSGTTTGAPPSWRPVAPASCRRGLEARATGRLKAGAPSAISLKKAAPGRRTPKYDLDPSLFSGNYALHPQLGPRSPRRRDL